MSITSAIVLFAVLWFLCMLLVLPFGVRSQEEAGDVTPGTPSGAPEKPMIGKKMRWATIGAAIGWLVVYGVIEGRVITQEDIRMLQPFD